MGGFADLNSFSEEPIEFTDNRPANVIFSSPVTQDQALTTTDFTITVTRPYEIEEIIQPDVALVSYSIDVSGVAGTTVAWDTVPSGSTVTVINGVYTIDGIDDLDEWDIVKDPTITIPADFLGSFFYEVSVNYTTAAGLQTYSWEVGVQVPVSIMQSTTTFVSSGDRIRLSNAQLNVLTNQTITGDTYETTEANLSLSFSINVDADVKFVTLSEPNDITYFTNTDFTITNHPTILEPDDTFTMTITPSIASAIDNMRIDELQLTEQWSHSETNGDAFYLADARGTSIAGSRVAIRTRRDSAGTTDFLTIFDLQSGNIINPYNLGSFQSQAAKGNYFIIGDASGSPSTNFGEVRIYDTNGTFVRTISSPDQGTENLISSIFGFGRFGHTIDTNGTSVIIGNSEYPYDQANNDEGRAYVYDISTGNLIYELASLGTGAFGQDVEISNNSFAVKASLYSEKQVHIYNLNDGSLRTSLVGRGIGMRLSDSYIALADLDGITVYDLDGNVNFNIIKNNINIPNLTDFGESIAMNDDYLAAAAKDSDNNQLYIFVYNMSTGQLVSTITDANWISEFDAIDASSVDITDNNELVIVLSTYINYVRGGYIVKIDLTINNSLTFNPATKVATISGDREKINNDISNIIVTPVDGVTLDFTLDYQAERSDNKLSDVKTQNVNNV